MKSFISNLIKLFILFGSLYFLYNNYLNIQKKSKFEDVISLKEKPITHKIENQLPIMKLDFIDNTFQEHFFGILRKYVFPLESNSDNNSSKEIIEKIKKNNSDFALLDEESFTNYINNTKNPNYSVISNCYDISFLFLAIENSNIQNLTDLKKKNMTIGVIEYDLPFLKTILTLCNIKDIKINVEKTYKDLASNLGLKKNKIIFFLDTKKNNDIELLTKKKNCRFITPFATQSELKNNKNIFNPNNYRYEPYMIYKNSKINNFEDIYKKKIGYYKKEDETEFKELLKVNMPFFPSAKDDVKTMIKKSYKAKSYKDLLEQFKNKKIDVLFLSQNIQKRQVILKTFNQSSIKESKNKLNELYRKFDKNFIVKTGSKIKNLIHIYDKNIIIGLIEDDYDIFVNYLLDITQIFIPKNNNINYIKRYQIIKYKNNKDLIKDFDTSSNKFIIFTKVTLKPTKKHNYISIKYIYDIKPIKRYIINIIQKKTFTNNILNTKLLNLNTNLLFKKIMDKKEHIESSSLINRDKLIRMKFNNLFTKNINLNDFYNNINIETTLKTYSTRLLLVVRNDIKDKYVEIVTRNFINKLKVLKYEINKYSNEKDNYFTYDVYDAFIFDNLLNVNNLISIHNGAKNIYKKTKLLKEDIIMETNLA